MYAAVSRSVWARFGQPSSSPGEREFAAVAPETSTLASY